MLLIHSFSLRNGVSTGGKGKKFVTSKSYHSFTNSPGSQLSCWTLGSSLTGLKPPLSTTLLLSFWYSTCVYTPQIQGMNSCLLSVLDMISRKLAKESFLCWVACSMHSNASVGSWALLCIPCCSTVHFAFAWVALLKTNLSVLSLTSVRLLPETCGECAGFVVQVMPSFLSLFLCPGTRQAILLVDISRSNFVFHTCSKMSSGYFLLYVRFQSFFSFPLS